MMYKNDIYIQAIVMCIFKSPVLKIIGASPAPVVKTSSRQPARNLETEEQVRWRRNGDLPTYVIHFTTHFGSPSTPGLGS